MSDDALTPEIATALPNIKPVPRSDFVPHEFDLAIVTKGYDLWWARSAPCPCVNNDQTEQADIKCPLCKGTGYFQFQPDPTIARGGTVDRYGNKVEVSEDGKYLSVMGIMTSLTQDIQVFEKFGEWTFGTARITLQAGNRLGYRDRIIVRKSEMVYAQHVDYVAAATIPVVGARNKHGLRYQFIRVHTMRSVAREYVQDVDFRLSARGDIEWLSQFIDRPSTHTRLVIHGTVRPVWIVMDHVNSYRDTQIAGANNSNVKRTLPVQAVVKLEFLVEPE